MGYNCPGPEAVELHLNRVGVGTSSFQSVNCPHREIADQKKGNHFTSWFSSQLLERKKLIFQKQHVDGLTCSGVDA